MPLKHTSIFKLGLLTLMMLMFGPSVQAAPSLKEVRPTARCWFVVDEITGTTLRFNRQGEVRPIASTTKLITALAVIQAGNLDSWVTVSQNAANQVPSKMGLKPGEKWKREDLLKALLIKSANDAATALAEDHSGTERLFCAKLTKLAKQMGCQKTVIRKASGLPSSGQGSTARDLAEMTAQAMKNPLIKKITSMKSTSIRSSTGRVIWLKSKNRLLDSSAGKVIGKTGYTRRAGRCFAGSMQFLGRPYTVVILGSKDLWGDLRTLRTWTDRFVKALSENRQRLSRQDVIRWQKKLKANGFDPGPADGIWGAKTQRALIDYQLKKKRVVNGRV